MRKRFPVLIATIFVLVFMSYVFGIPKLFAKKEEYVKVNVLEIVGNTVIIGHNCTAIIAQTSPERARNIKLGIDGIIPERPTTHDTIAQILKSFNITLEKVVITRFDGTYYYAFMYLRSKNKLLKLDVMPSDGIAVAVRLHAPIYINKTLLDKEGKNICQ